VKVLSRFSQAPALMAAAVFAVAGGGFVVATLIMARLLSEREFGQAVLMIALCNVAIAAGPSGVNGIALRHDRRTDRRLVLAGAICVLATAALACALGALLYELRPIAVAVLGAAIFTGGMTMLTRSAFQRAMALQKMVILSQIPNIALLFAAGLMTLGIGRIGWFPSLIVATAYVAIGSYAWNWVRHHQREGAPIEGRHWRDAVNFGGLSLSSEVMMQLERLLVPLAMGAEALGLFAVVAAVALTPFRMLELGTIATLVARLRKIESAPERLRLLRNELFLLLSLCLAGGILIVLGAPLLCEMVLEERRVSTALVVAVVISGITRVGSALAHSAAMAFCEGAQLRLVHAGNWLAVLVGAALAVALAPLGLEGMVYGVAGGWLCRMLLTGFLSARQLREAGTVEVGGQREEPAAG
jgi:hypothetical protein